MTSELNTTTCNFKEFDALRIDKITFFSRVTLLAMGVPKDISSYILGKYQFKFEFVKVIGNVETCEGILWLGEESTKLIDKAL